MVYESDFYTTRRPYRPSSYSVTRQSAGDWEKVPFVPRPSLVPDPVTAFGRRGRAGARSSVLDPVTRQNIPPKPESKLAPLAPYVSPREQTRERVLAAVGHRERAFEADPLGTPRDHMDVLLAHAHGRPLHAARRHTPRHYVVADREPLPRRAEEQYSYSYSSTSERSTGSGLPQRSSYSSSVERRAGSGPGGYSYTSERSSSLGGPSGYSYSSTSSGRLPYGTTYRHYSYRV
ncbi:hypothetical protein RR46_08553 [Papilio xuthus]|uniref:Protein anoxia up-regulated n=1 Tax=Papilio xuthus TaxID=66420 RepID=A0A194QDI1_PAPXU|nr:hypothetical protein RR46_08553 [Papilio xuthus]